MSVLESIDFSVFSEAMPEAVTALRTLGRLSGQDLPKDLVELVKARASQINGCAYCLQLHLNWARAAGVPQGKLDCLPLWREAAGFSEQERAALGWTEALSAPGRHDQVEAARGALATAFDTEQQMRLTIAIATINAWNRIAGPLRFTPPQAQ